jgi:ribosomal protein S18 acetylase RimI-like enzyme
VKGICSELSFKCTGKKEHLLFNLYEYSFFRKSQQNRAMFFRIPPILSALLSIPYLVSLELILLKTRRYFVVLENQIVGLFAIEQYYDSLYVATLAVAQEVWRHSIATCILDCITSLGKRMNADSIELSVLRTNIPAQKLYVKCGFGKKAENPLSLILTKRIRDAKS